MFRSPEAVRQKRAEVIRRREQRAKHSNLYMRQLTELNFWMSPGQLSRLHRRTFRG